MLREKFYTSSHELTSKILSIISVQFLQNRTSKDNFDLNRNFGCFLFHVLTNVVISGWRLMSEEDPLLPLGYAPVF